MIRENEIEIKKETCIEWHGDVSSMEEFAKEFIGERNKCYDIILQNTSDEEKQKIKSLSPDEIRVLVALAVILIEDMNYFSWIIQISQIEHLRNRNFFSNKDKETAKMIYLEGKNINWEIIGSDYPFTYERYGEEDEYSLELIKLISLGIALIQNQYWTGASTEQEYDMKNPLADLYFFRAENSLVTYSKKTITFTHPYGEDEALRLFQNFLVAKGIPETKLSFYTKYNFSVK